MDEFENFILKDCVIETQSDMCLKIRADLSIKNMG